MNLLPGVRSHTTTTDRDAAERWSALFFGFLDSAV
jgi:hypothetical protein